MSPKGSYRQKHREQTGENDLPQETGHPLPPISEEKKALFEAGEVLLIDKPLHWTSFDVVRKIRSRIRIKKVGHAGTLDPLATGLLIVCTGRFTKKINEYMAREKEYTGAFTIGAVTPTYDLESLPEKPQDISNITKEQIESILPGFIGEIQQVPPVYSAIKKQGTALYELARRGVAVEPEPRTIFIKSFGITEIALPVLRFKIVCSTGTYIRSVANDFGAKLGCGAYLSELRRTRIGELSVDAASGMDAFMMSLL